VRGRIALDVVEIVPCLGSIAEVATSCPGAVPEAYACLSASGACLGVERRLKAERELERELTAAAPSWAPESEEPTSA
jgi:hypothetical protein